MPIASVWSLVSLSSRLSEWMPMVEKCTKLAGEEGVPGYTRLISGLMFPSDDGDRSWLKERLILMDSPSYSYVYKMESSNVGLDGSMNTLRLVDYGEGSTLVEWEFQIDPMEGADEETVVDYLGFVYRSCINRIERAIEQATNKE